MHIEQKETGMGNSKADGIDRRSFLKGAAIAGSAVALTALAGCSEEKEADAANGSGDAESTARSAYAQAQPKSFPADYIVSPDAEWELFAAVKAVSYTHLDVYKRQAGRSVEAGLAVGAQQALLVLVVVELRIRPNFFLCFFERLIRKLVVRFLCKYVVDPADVIVPREVLGMEALADHRDQIVV